jgi:hypothetical protein
MKIKKLTAILLLLLIILPFYPKPTVVEAQTPDLARVFATYLGGTAEDTLRDAVIMPDGTIYACGGSASSTWPTAAEGGASPYDSSFNGTHDFVVVKISPTGQLQASTFYGGPNYERAYAIEVVSDGVIVAGRAGASCPTGTSLGGSVMQPTFAGDASFNGVGGHYGTQDGFIVKFNFALTSRIWATYIGDTGSAFVRDIAVDSSDNIYVAMAECWANAQYISASGVHDSSHNGPTPNANEDNFCWDGAVVKVNANGASKAWGTYIGGSGSDGATPSIRVNAANEIYYMHGSDSINAPTTSGVVQPAKGSGTTLDMHIAKFNTNGGLIWATYMGGSNSDFIETHGLAIDLANDQLIAGFTTLSTNLTTTSGVVQPAHAGNGGSGNYPGDCYVVRLNSTGTARVAATYLGGTSGEGLEGLNLGPDGSIYFTGSTTSANFPTTAGAQQTTKSTGYDQFVVKMAANMQSLTYSSFYGGGGGVGGLDEGRSSAINADGDFVIVGLTMSSTFPVFNAIDPTWAGNGARDATIIKFELNNAGPSNQAPNVNAGLDQPITLPSVANLDGSASDDGLPSGVLNTTWTMQSGPASVTFGNASAQDTTATFTVPGTYVLRLTASDTSLQSTDDVTITVSAAASCSLPSGWLSADIGPVGVAGQSCESGGVFTVDGAGADIWARESAYRFTYRQSDYTGTTEEIVTLVSSIENTHPYAKAGVMVAQTLRPDSKFAAMVLTPNGAQFLYRQTRGTKGIIGGAVESGTGSIDVRPPYWVRVRRVGQQFSGWISPDGDPQNWTQIGNTVNINMLYDTGTGRSPLYVGMCVTSHDTTQLATAVFDNVSSNFASSGSWFYVSPIASRTGTGTWENPYHIKQVFNGTDVAAITDGSYVWLLGDEGDYVGRWRTDLAGAIGNPIVVRGYPDERVRFNGLVTTKLTSDITTTANTTFTVETGDYISVTSKEIRLGTVEDLKGTAGGANGNTITTTSRAFGGTAQTCASSPTTHCAGAVVIHSAPTIQVNGSNVIYRDFEVASLSAQSRYRNVESINSFGRPATLENLSCNRCTFINLFLHDGGDDVTDQVGADNSIWYGGNIFNNGTPRISGGGGHNVYPQADTPKSIKEVLTGFSYKNSINMSSTTAPVVWEGVIVYYPGNSSVRTSSDLTFNECVNNGDDLQIGPDAGGTGGVLTFTNNWWGQRAKIQAFTSGVISGNKIFPAISNSGATMEILLRSGGASTDYAVTNNQLWRGRQGLKKVLELGGVSYAYNSSQSTSPFFQSLTGAGATTYEQGCVYSNQTTDVQNSAPCFFHENTNQSTGVRPNTDKVIPLRVNLYDANLANVAGWDFDADGFITVPNTASFLSAGDIYVVIFSGNPFGEYVIGPTVYVSGDLMLPMAQREMAHPIGDSLKLNDSATFKAFTIKKL